MRVSRLQREDVRRHRQEFRGPDYLPSQVTGERSDGHLRQDARHEPLVADLASLDEVQRDRRGHREYGVQPVDLVLHKTSLPGVLLIHTRIPSAATRDAGRQANGRRLAVRGRPGVCARYAR